MSRSYFEGIKKKVREKPDLSYLFDSSEQYGSWKGKRKRKTKKKESLKNFLEEYEDFQNGGR